jgi:hypothetical protein
MSGALPAYPPQASIWIDDPNHVAELGFILLLAITASKAVGVIGIGPGMTVPAYENRVGRIAVNAMSAKRTHRIRGSASILRSNSIAIIGTAMIA